MIDTSGPRPKFVQPEMPPGLELQGKPQDAAKVAAAVRTEYLKMNPMEATNPKLDDAIQMWQSTGYGALFSKYISTKNPTRRQQEEFIDQRRKLLIPQADDIALSRARGYYLNNQDYDPERFERPTEAGFRKFIQTDKGKEYLFQVRDNVLTELGVPKADEPAEMPVSYGPAAPPPAAPPPATATPAAPGQFVGSAAEQRVRAAAQAQVDPRRELVISRARELARNAGTNPNVAERFLAPYIAQAEKEIPATAGRAPAGSIRVRNRETGQTGSMPAANFNPERYERIQ